MPPSRLYRFLSTSWWLTFLLMGVCFVLFGLTSLNLVQTLMANFDLISRHGTDALREGALLQLLELTASGYAAALFYLGFKLCEKILVDRLSTAHAHNREPAPETAAAPENGNET